MRVKGVLHLHSFKHQGISNTKALLLLLLNHSLFFTVYGKTRVVRSCGFIEDHERDGKACVQRSGTHDVHILYCACKGDICNPATHLTASAIAVFTLSLLCATTL